MTVDLDRSEARPYFLWDEDLSIAEFRERLADRDSPERLRLRRDQAPAAEVTGFEAVAQDPMGVEGDGRAPGRLIV